VTENQVAGLARFSPATRTWFERAFAAPTAAQEAACQAIADGTNALVVAPTGSGKTLAAFLWALDRLSLEPTPEKSRRLRVLYISPLKALAADVERNLRSPLVGIGHARAELGEAPADIVVATRTGDTPADQRRRLVSAPPDILITTPESLFLLLTSKAREVLGGIDTVIVDEVHALAATKRGAHLALSLERLDALLDKPAQRVGLSATVRPAEEVARFLGGVAPVTIVAPPSEKVWDLSVVVPVEDMAAIGEPLGGVFEGNAAGDPRRASMWPHVEEHIVDLVSEHRSTIVFANSRRLAERLTARMNEEWVERTTGVEPVVGQTPAEVMALSGSTAGVDQVLARAHHGSVSKEQRKLIEDDLKSGRIPAVVATSSLELGIDMGAVDLVVQVESPPSVASGLQRVGRAGHQVGVASRGVFMPKHRGDLVQTAVVVERMRAGLIEEMHVVRNPLDVLAQQIVAAVAMDDWNVDGLYELAKRSAPFHDLTLAVFEAVLDMLAGRYPSDEFAELRPRLVWDRVTNELTGRPGAQRLAVTSGGTIPDRGLFPARLVGERRTQVGELDEEMVYESRVGDVIALGATSWRIEDITANEVLVSPAPGQPGRLPFWKGDAIGRPVELGRALGAFIREVRSAEPEAAAARLRETGLDPFAANNLIAYLAEQQRSTGHVPDDRTIVVERFRDELGDWRVVVHTPFGARVHAPWALAVSTRLREQHGMDVQAVHSDDGFLLRLPDTDDDSIATQAAESVVLDPDEVEALVTDAIGGSPMFAGRFREAAGRALLLPRRSPTRRQPLWQQRQRSAQLLSVASKHAQFPLVLEAVREVMQDDFDVKALVGLLRDVQSRKVRVVDVATDRPSPFAASLLFGYIAAYMYDGDQPLAERRAHALTLDTGLLAELLGQAELRDLLDLDAIDAVEAELQRLVPERNARDLEDAADFLRLLGPLSRDEALERGIAAEWLTELSAARRIFAARIGGADRFVAAEDASRFRDAVGIALPPGLPATFTEPVADPLGDILSRYARTHVPFTADEVAARFGLGRAVVSAGLERLAATGRVTSGAFRPGGHGTEYVDPGVLRAIRRRSVALLRNEAEPVAPVTLGVFLPEWQSVGGRLRGVDGVLAVVEQLQGAAIPVSVLDTLVLPARISDYAPGMLDELTTAGEVTWAGVGSLPGGDGWVSLAPTTSAATVFALPDADVLTVEHQPVLELLSGGGAWFFRDVATRLEIPDADLQRLLFDLVWSGHITNDSVTPLRAGLGGVKKVRAPRPRYARASHRVRLPVPAAVAPVVSGRWSALPPRSADSTRNAAAVAQALLDRHGVLTREAVAAERVAGGWAAAYRVLRAFDETGRAQRAYVVEGLGGSQFAVPGAIDALRDVSGRLAMPHEPVVTLLAATDPANPYGAALTWPESAAGGHRPGRKAGALVVLVDGELVLYVEKGGRTLLTFSASDDALSRGVDAVAKAARSGRINDVVLGKIDGDSADARVSALLEAAGFVPTPRGHRMRSGG
jgi:ATP-dependent Lhr-like helicase